MARQGIVFEKHAAVAVRRRRVHTTQQYNIYINNVSSAFLHYVRINMKCIEHFVQYTPLDNA